MDRATTSRSGRGPPLRDLARDRWDRAKIREKGGITKKPDERCAKMDARVSSREAFEHKEDVMRTLTRRELLRYATVGSAALALAACQPKIVEVTKIVEKPVERLVEGNASPANPGSGKGEVGQQTAAQGPRSSQYATRCVRATCSGQPKSRLSTPQILTSRPSSSRFPVATSSMCPRLWPCMPQVPLAMPCGLRLAL